MAKDVKKIDAAIKEDNLREALRCADGRSTLATDAKVRRDLPGMFPSGALPSDTAPSEATDDVISKILAGVEASFPALASVPWPGPQRGQV